MFNSNPFGSAKFGGGVSQPSSVQSGGGGDLTSQIINTVKQDMETVEKSGQWIFSCYSPAKDCASVPGNNVETPGLHFASLASQSRGQSEWHYIHFF